MALTDSSSPLGEVLVAVLLGEMSGRSGAEELAVARARELVLCEEVLLFLRGLAASRGYVTYDQIWRLSRNRGLFRGVVPTSGTSGHKGQVGQ